MSFRPHLVACFLCLLAMTSMLPPGGAEAGGEPSLQAILDGALGEGCVDASTDNGMQTFPAGTYRFTFLAAYTDGYGSLAWTPAGDNATHNTIFGVKDSPGATATITIPVPFALRYGGWFSETVFNGDAYDHFRAFAMCGAAGSIAAGFEDVFGGGDMDHQDYVITIEPATRQTFSFGYNYEDEGAGLVLGPGAARSVQGTFIPLPGPSLLSGGDIEIEVVENPPGCGTPTVTVSGFDFEIVWPDPCFDYGEDVVVCIRTDKGPLEVQSVGLYDSEDKHLFTPKAEEGSPLPLCGDEPASEVDCSGAMAMISSVWPPNHSLVPVSITGVTSTSGEPITITVTGVTQDEAVNGNGDGDTCPDATIVDGVARVRMERSGSGDGRVYLLTFVASDGLASCEGSVTVCVPHDLGSGSCVDGGQTVNALECAPEPPPTVRLQRGRPRPGAAEPGVTSIGYSLPAAGEVSLGLYDVAGRLVRSLVGGAQPAGEHSLSWSTTGLTSGVYFYRLRVGAQVATTTLVIAR